MARILLIEDDPNALEMLRFRLEKEKHTVIEALDGDQGLEKALRRPDLIILDVRLPKIDGWELCRIIKTDSRIQHIPVIMLTGCSQPIQEEYGRQCGANAYLTKPWDPKQLLDLTRKLLHKES